MSFSSENSNSMTMNEIRCHYGLVCHPITSGSKPGDALSNGDGGCRLWMWMWKDPPAPEREKNIILGLLKKCNKLDEENERLRMKMKYLDIQ
ncbi:hypothetical protein LIER_34841 [Lithospermum erythrorhizon]|uniref:Uncharacterized protein n=1 Tax=Lithospermum erythrorhizon TaxID=34254 RepID=A0AAV3S2D9_LITER